MEGYSTFVCEHCAECATAPANTLALPFFVQNQSKRTKASFSFFRTLKKKQGCFRMVCAACGNHCRVSLSFLLMGLRAYFHTPSGNTVHLYPVPT